MNSLERFFTATSFEEPDRVPINIWIYRPERIKFVEKKYGSMANFIYEFDIDIYTAFSHNIGVLFEDELKRSEHERTPEEILNKVELFNPDDPRLYLSHRHSMKIDDAVKEFKGKKVVFGHVWGIFEAAQSLLGFENLLMNVALEKDAMKEIFRHLGDWDVGVANNLMDKGVDVIEISDDYGSTEALLISPHDWREMILPNLAKIVQAAHQRNVLVSLHSDGNIREILDDLVEIGVDILQPVQETAKNMDQKWVKKRFAKKLCIYGGLDIVSVLPDNSGKDLDKEIKQKMHDLKSGGGFIFCSSHTVQADTSWKRVEQSLSAALKHSRY